MLHDFIGREAFKNGMKHYLTTHSYQNTQTEDLWASLETASGKPELGKAGASSGFSNSWGKKFLIIIKVVIKAGFP